MALYTSCIYHQNHPGRRISVMSKHTLADGRTPDPRITEQSYDEWLRILAPPLRLVGDYYQRGLSWEQFATHYRAYLQWEDVNEKVAELSHRALTGDITLLCVEEEPEKCHRRLLAQECKRERPELSVVIK